MPQQEPAWLVQRRARLQWMKASEYYAEFGRTREERADNMYNIQGQSLAPVPGHPSMWRAPSQASEMLNAYVVQKYQGQSCACTCSDFVQHAVYDDTFACKHMLLRQQ